MNTNNMIKLCDLKLGEAARVTKISPNNRIRRRLIDIGLIEGTKVSCVCLSPTGGMRAYLIRGASVAIRDEDICDVFAERIG